MKCENLEHCEDITNLAIRQPVNWHFVIAKIYFYHQCALFINGFEWF